MSTTTTATTAVNESLGEDDFSLSDVESNGSENANETSSASSVDSTEPIGTDTVKARRAMTTKSTTKKARATKKKAAIKPKVTKTAAKETASARASKKTARTTLGRHERRATKQAIKEAAKETARKNAQPALGPKLNELFYTTNTRVGKAIIERAIPCFIQFRRRHGCVSKRYEALMLPDNTYIAASEPLIGTHTALDLSAAHSAMSTSINALKRYGQEDAHRIYSSATAFAQAVFYDHCARAFCHKRGVPFAALRKRIVDRSDVSALITDGIKQVFMQKTHALPRDNTVLLQETFGTCGARTGRMYVKICLSGGEIVDISKFEVGHLVPAAVADRVPLELRGSGNNTIRLASVEKAKIFQTESSNESAIREAIVQANTDTIAFAAERRSEQEAKDRALRAKTAAKNNKTSAAKKKKAEKDSDEETIVLASGSVVDKVVPEPALARKRTAKSSTTARKQRAAASSVATTVMRVAIEQDTSLPRGMASGRQEGARDIIGLLNASSLFDGRELFDDDSAKKTGDKALDSRDAFEWLTTPSVKQAPIQLLPLPVTRCTKFVGENQIAMTIKISAAARGALAAIVRRADGTNVQKKFVETQPFMKRFVESGFAVDNSILVLSPATVSREAWPRVSCAGDDQFYADFCRGVTNAVEILLMNGRAPGVLLHEAGDQPLRNDSAPGVAVVREVLADPVSGTTCIEPGVIAERAFAEGEPIGVYKCDVVLGGQAELDGEATVWKIAGYSPLDAEDAYAVSARRANGQPVTVSARSSHLTGVSVLSRMNHSSAPNARLLDIYDERDGGVMVEAVRAIAPGEMLSIDYGDDYVRGMTDLGVSMCISLGPVANQEPKLAVDESAAIVVDEPEWLTGFVFTPSSPPPAHLALSNAGDSGAHFGGDEEFEFDANAQRSAMRDAAFATNDIASLIGDSADDLMTSSSTSASIDSDDLFNAGNLFDLPF